MGIITDLSLRWLYRLTDLIHIKYFLVAQLIKNHLQCRRPQFDSWAGKILCRRDRLPIPVFLGFPRGSDGKESTYNAGDLGLIPGLGGSPGGGRGNPLHYSCLENPHGQRSLEGYRSSARLLCSWDHKGSDMTEQLSTAPLTPSHPVII